MLQRRWNAPVNESGNNTKWHEISSERWDEKRVLCWSAFQVMFPERQLCHQQYNATPLDSTRDFYSFSHFKQATQDKLKPTRPLKTVSILSSCPLQNVLKKAKPSAWFLFRLWVEISSGRKQRANTVTSLLLSPNPPSRALLRMVSQLAS